MSCAAEDRRTEALRQLERTRTHWLARCARAQHTPAEPSPANTDGFNPGSPLNAIVSEWLAAEVAARLWPEPAAGDSDAPSGDEATTPTPQTPMGGASQALQDVSQRHPWLCVLVGLLAGGLAVSQRQQLLRWGISTALPWLSAQASVIAVPLFAQWLARRPAPPPSPADPAEASNTSGIPPVDAPPDINVPNSAAAGSPG